MSQRFEKFVDDIARNTHFEIRKDNLKSYLQDFATQRRPSYYKKLMFILQMKWPKYKHGGKISYLLKRYSDVIYDYWLTMIFIFRKASLKVKNPTLISNVDFSIEIQYTYNKDEMQVIKDICDKYKLGTPEKRLDKEGVALFLLLYPALALERPISKIFGPFVFFLQNSSHSYLEDDNFNLNLKIGAREY